MLLRGQSKLAGVIAMSAYLPISDEPGALSAQNKATPILLCHGDADQVVGVGAGGQARVLPGGRSCSW